MLNRKEDGCFFCGNPQVQEHHIFGGSNRKHSEKYKLVVYLCRHHHTDSPSGVHHNKEMMDYLHRLGQEEFEQEHSREKFMRTFGRNYL